VAQVADDVKGRIDDFLDYLAEEWLAIPRVAQEWADWSPYERLDFVLEWPIREERLEQLQVYAERGLLTPAQNARYAALRQLVQENRGTLEELLAD
jgi:hypothetical protein